MKAATLPQLSKHIDLVISKGCDYEIRYDENRCPYIVATNPGDGSNALGDMIDAA